jgi:hypothetical protein
MRSAIVRPAILTAGCALIFTGCMVPPHRLPHGFSSSYHRQLYGMEPVVIGGVPDDSIPPNTSPGVFFPARVQLNAPPSASTPDPQARASSKPLPISIPPAPPPKKSASKSR